MYRDEGKEFGPLFPVGLSNSSPISIEIGRSIHTRNARCLDLELVTAFSRRGSLFERAFTQLEAISFLFLFLFFWKKIPTRFAALPLCEM